MALAPMFRELIESRPESTYSNWQNCAEILFRSSNKSAVSNISFVITKQELTGLWLHHAHNKRWKTPILQSCNDWNMYLGTNFEIFGRGYVYSLKDLAILEDLEHTE